MADPLSNLLSVIFVNECKWSVIQLADDARCTIARSQALECFFGIEGETFVDGGEQRKLAAGEAMLCLGHCDISIAATTNARTGGTPLDDASKEAVPWIIVGQGRPAALVIRARIEAPLLRSMSLFRLLPPVLTSSTEKYFAIPMRGLRSPAGVRELLSGAGGEEIGRRLAGFMLVQIVRSHIVEQTSSSWKNMMIERRVAKAVELLHAHPADYWTVEKLAAQVGMSRTAFSHEFSAATGEAPIGYLTRIRMITASEILRNREVSLSEVAHHIGYSSNIAFVRAFKRYSGFTPAQLQAQHEPVERRGPPANYGIHPAFIFDWDSK